MPLGFGQSITHQYQDCISGKQGRVEEIEIHSSTGNDQQFEDTGDEIRHTNGVWKRVKREANISVNDFEVGVMVKRNEMSISESGRS